MKKVLVITSAIFLLAAACNKQAAVGPAQNQSSSDASSEQLLKVQMVTSISDTQFLGSDLKSYFKVKNTYPQTLNAFIDDKTYDNERSFITNKDQLTKYQYVTSTDHQHFVLYINLSLPKDQIGKVNTQPIDSVNGTILGIDCSNSKVYCVSDSK